MLSRAEAKRLGKLVSHRKHRDREGLFVAEGVRVVEELLAADVVIRMALVSSSLGDTERGARLRSRLEASSAPGGSTGAGDAMALREVPDVALREIADTATTQGVLVVAETPRVGLGAVALGGPSIVLVVDGVQDPGNMGTLVRSAAAFDCDAVACLPGTVDPWNPKVVRASAGAVVRLPVVQTSLEDLSEWLGRHGYLMAAADAEGPPVGAGALPERVALVMGNEGAGVTAAVAARCERKVSIPMPGGTESLNVAVAGAILLYELNRGRG